MNVFRLSLVIVTFIAAGCAQQSLPADLSPASFSEGTTFSVDPTAPFARFELPRETFTATAYADLRDIRVFNSAGESVPFARVKTSMPVEVVTVPLRTFRLVREAPGGQPEVELEAHDRGVALRVTPAPSSKEGVNYVLAADEQHGNVMIERLRFQWKPIDRSWEQRVTVSISRDLRNWTTVAAVRPLMDLRTDQGDRLTQNEIEISQAWRERGRYWRLQFDSGFAPQLTGVDGESRGDQIVPDPMRINARGTPAADGSVTYQLPGPQPASRLRITPADANSVLPMRIDARSSASGEWRSVARTVVYRVNAMNGEEHSASIPAGDGLIAEIRLRAAGVSFGSKIPTVDLERDPVTLIVNTRGAGPFLLAWGSRAADTDTSLPPASLVPGFTDESVFSLPRASMSEPTRELGGRSRLTEALPAERAAQWKTVLVWTVLVVGVAALALFAWTIARTSGPPGS